MHDDSKFAGNGHGRALEPQSLTQLQPPLFDSTLIPGPCQECDRGLVQQSTQTIVASSAASEYFTADNQMYELSTHAMQYCTGIARFLRRDPFGLRSELAALQLCLNSWLVERSVAAARSPYVRLQACLLPTPDALVYA